MSVQQNIETKIRSSLAPSHLEVIDESHMHSVPPGSESHFRVVVVSERFEGVVRAKFQILGAAIEPLRSTRKNARKSMTAKSGSDVLAK